jgi:hypothetical protein
VTPGFLLRNTGDLADKQSAVEVEECLKHLTLGTRAHQIIGGKRGIRL